MNIRVITKGMKKEKIYEFNSNTIGKDLSTNIEGIMIGEYSFKKIKKIVPKIFPILNDEMVIMLIFTMPNI